MAALTVGGAIDYLDVCVYFNVVSVDGPVQLFQYTFLGLFPALSWGKSAGL
jgi:hypothetical protein